MPGERFRVKLVDEDHGGSDPVWVEVRPGQPPRSSASPPQPAPGAPPLLAPPHAHLHTQPHRCAGGPGGFQHPVQRRRPHPAQVPAAPHLALVDARHEPHPLHQEPGGCGGPHGDADWRRVHHPLRAGHTHLLLHAVSWAGQGQRAGRRSAVLHRAARTRQARGGGHRGDTGVVNWAFC